MNRTRRLFAAICTAAVIAGLGPIAAAQERIAISAPWGVGPDGALMKDVTVVIAAGRIERVLQGPANVQADRSYKFESGVISPGLIDVASTLGVVGDNFEQTRSVDADLSVVDAVDAHDSVLLDAARAGVTAAMLAPARVGVVSGACATIRTMVEEGVDRVLRGDGPLTITLGPGSWDDQFGASSRSGVLQELRELMRRSKSEGGTSRLARAARGELDLLVEAPADEDVDAATQLFGQYGLTPSIRHVESLVDTADELAESGGVVVVGPYTFATDVRQLAGPAHLASAGGEIAFCGGLPYLEPDALRVSAALAVRYGLDPAAARRGLTINAARVAGLGNRVGALIPGADADIVVFSHDPLRLDARVLEVWVGGRRVHRAAPAAAETEDGWKAW